MPNKKKYNCEAYTIGWICALSVEYAAAQACLDEVHKKPHHLPNEDVNKYTVGRIGEHNVVITLLPFKRPGTAAAASVATDMKRSFPSIKIGLMVGIGGGVPSEKHDIRLGDVVVGISTDGNAAVIQYDLGKKYQNRSLKQTGFFNQPPDRLRIAVGWLEGQQKSIGTLLGETIDDILKKHQRFRKKFERPHPSTDRLYNYSFIHPEGDKRDCEEVCGSINLDRRAQEREENEIPVVHYGLIASGNQVIKDAILRNECAKKGALCVEMEAAGLMNILSCLVIRGICDYSDSHKNDKWQPYAALVAAAYAKNILFHVNTIETVTSSKKKFENKLLKHLHLFRLTQDGKDITYEWYKDRVEQRVEGTCQWFTKNSHFKSWESKQGSGLLFVSADPGGGKSVLAKHLIDTILPEQKEATICYFFFKDQVQNTVRQALCAILHQLFQKNHSLLEHVENQIGIDGPGLINSVTSLWTIFKNAVQNSKAGTIIIVLDALDECLEPELMDLLQKVKTQFNSGRLRVSKLKYLLTSRPYESILSEFRLLFDESSCINIPGEEESDTIGEEIDLVIRHKVKQLQKAKSLSDKISDYLMVKLCRIEHRTYLWVHLIFDYLRSKELKQTTMGVEVVMEKMPRTVNEAYEHILQKSKDDRLVQNALSIILAATRPLSISEMNIAMHMHDIAELQSSDGLDLEEDEHFKSRLRSCCGLFVSVYNNQIYLLHQTAREFLLNDLQSQAPILPGLKWCHSITILDSNAVIAESCVRYLNLLNHKIHNANGVVSLDFLDYSAKSWAFHFRKACISDDASIIPIAMSICNPGSSHLLKWIEIYWPDIEKKYLEETISGIVISSYFGLEAIIKRLLLQNRDINMEQIFLEHTPLLWAAKNGHKIVVALLIERGACIEAKNERGQTPLLLAIQNGHDTVVELLVENGANIEATDNQGGTPLVYAIKNQHELGVGLLLKTKTNAKVQGRYDDGPLSIAAQSGQKAIVELLIAHHVSIETKTDMGLTPLMWAAIYGLEAIAELLLQNNANINATNPWRHTSLSFAAQNGNEAVARLLIDNKASIDVRDCNGQTALLRAADHGHEALIRLLLDNGANIENSDKHDRTALLLAAMNGHEAAVELLLERKANLKKKDFRDQSALSLATSKGWEAVVMLLVCKGDIYYDPLIAFSAIGRCKKVLQDEDQMPFMHIA